MYDNNGDFNFMSMTWAEVWQRAVTDPSEETYETIISDPAITTGRAYTWVAVSAAISAMISAIGSLINPNVAGLEIGQYICAVPLAAVFAPIGLMIGTVIINIFAKAMDGSGSFDRLIIGFAAVNAPLTVIVAAIGLVPVIGPILVLLVGLYGMYLIVIVTKVVHRFGWAKAFTANFGIMLLVACGVICLLTVLAPEVGDVFDRIQRTLEAQQ